MKKDKAASSSDNGVDAQILCVSNYHLEDDDRLPVSFAALPIQWGKAESSDATKEQVFLHGSADNQMQIMVQVSAWRFDLSNAKPEISLLSSKDKTWIKLQKPRNSFHDAIRTILVTVHFLHRMKKNPNTSSKSVWDNLFKVKELSAYKLKPSQKDLLDHMSLIAEATKRDVVLAKSKMLLAVLKEKLRNKKLSDEEVKDLIQPAFVNEAKEESKGEDKLSVCALCDDGGDVVNCDGPCMRSFHVTEEDGRQSMCDSLCLTPKDIEGRFYCKNCEYNQHQCFACGKLGSSGNVKAAEVIKCAYATCEHFYHPHCVAKLPSQVVGRQIADANSFTCPVHYCWVCKEVENKKQHELQFAVCRRCPKSYHRKCLPREISFGDTDEDIETRAWDGLLKNHRILIYCLNHEIDEELGTPIRDHIKFPRVKATVQNINATKEKMKPAAKQKVISNKNSVDLHNPSGKSTAKGSKVTGKLFSGKVGSKEHSGSNISTKSKANGTSSLTNNKTPISKKSEKPDPEKSMPSSVLKSKCSKQTKPNNQVNNAVCKTLPVKPIRQRSSSSGSDDVNGGKIDKSNGPVLSHVSHSADGATKHKVVAQEHGNVSNQHDALKMESCNAEMLPADHTTDGNNDDNLSPSHNLLKSTADKDQTPKSGGKKRSSPHGNVGQENQGGKKRKMSKSGKTPLKRKRTKSGKTPLKRKRTEENETRGLSAGSSTKRQAVNEIKLVGVPDLCQPKTTDGKSSVEGNQLKSVAASPHVEARDNGDQHSEPIAEPESTCSEIEKGPCVATPLSDHGVTNTEELHRREEEKSRSESDIRQQVALCEAQGPDCSHGHGQPSSIPAVERYTPCRDELNNDRMISLGFAAGPNLAYSLLHSAGWLDE